MIVPIIHRSLRRTDLALLIAEIGQVDPYTAREARRDVDSGNVDSVLDSLSALQAVRGRGGTPGPLPLTILWYVPVRARLRERGEDAIDLADLTASLPVIFASSRALRRVGSGNPALTDWLRAIEALPPGTVGRAERAAYCAALALWWAGCFPERITRTGGEGALRAFGDFASMALEQAADALTSLAPDSSDLYRRAATRTVLLVDALHDTRADYLSRSAQTPTGRMRRFLDRLDAGE